LRSRDLTALAISHSFLATEARSHGGSGKTWTAENAEKREGHPREASVYPGTATASDSLFWG